MCVSTLHTVNLATINDFCTAYNNVSFSLNLDHANPFSQLCAENVLSLFNSTCTSILDYIAPLKINRTKPKSCPPKVFVDEQSASGRRTSFKFLLRSLGIEQRVQLSENTQEQGPIIFSDVIEKNCLSYIIH